MAETDGGDIVIRIRGDSSDLEEAVARTQGAISGLESGADSAADVLGDMGAAAKKTNVNLKGMAAQSLPAIAAGISTVNPAAGAMVGLMGQLAAVAGPLAIAVGVATAAFALYKHETDKAAEAAERAKESIEAFNDAFDNQAAITAELSRELRLINGQITEDGLAHEKRKDRIQRAGDAIVASLDEQIEAQQKLVDQASSADANMEELISAEALSAELDELNRQRGIAVGITEKQLEQADNVALFHRESKEAVEEHAGAQGKLANGIEQVNSSLQDQLALLDDFSQSIETGIGGSAPAGIDALVGRINDLTGSEEELLTASEMLKLEQSALDAEFTRGNVSLEQYDTLTGQVAGKQAELSEQTRGVEDAAKASEKALKLKGVQESLEATAELSGMLAEKLGEDSKKAALTMFRISKAAGLASIAISTAVGISKTIEEYGMTPIGIAASVGVGLLGAAQAATVAATPAPAHMGDPLAPDERRVSGRRVLATEAVLDSATTRRMGGEDGLRQAMRGGGSSQPVQVNLTYKHLDREVARLMRSNSRTRRAVRS